MPQQATSKQTTYLEIDDTSIVDSVWCDNKLKLLKWNRLSKSASTHENIQLSDVVHIPKKQLALYVQKGVILLPSNVGTASTSSDLYQKLATFIKKYVELTEDHLHITCLYILMTWIYDKFQSIPYLRVMGEPRSGKSRFLEVVQSLVYRGFNVGGATSTAAIFRTIDALEKVTLIYDEADQSYSRADSDLVKVLNQGYMQNGSIMRMDDKNTQAIAFKVFCPKVIATRFEWEDKALENRCLTFIMSTSEGSVPLHLPKEFKLESETLRNDLFRYRLDHLADTSIDISQLDASLSNRYGQIALPLLSLVENPVLQNRTTEILVRLKEEFIDSRENDPTVIVLKAIYMLLKQHTPILDYKSITEQINNLDISIGSYQYKLTPQMIGYVLKVLQIKKSMVSGCTRISNTPQNIQRLNAMFSKYRIAESVDSGDTVDSFLSSIDSSTSSTLLEKEVSEALL